MIPSHMSHRFSQVPAATIQRSSFDRSHGHKTTFDAGYLIPVLIDEVLPGDTFTVNMTAFARLATPQKPVMDNMFLDSFFFFVPNRLVWDHWQAFCGERTDPVDDYNADVDYLVPRMTGPDFAAGGIAPNSLSDYLGLPVGPGAAGSTGCVFNSLWHRAYNLIWNEWFRDQNLQDSVVVDKDDGPDTYTDYVLLRRGKRHDYFTSCLPWPQKGPDVLLPLGDTAPVTGAGTVTGKGQIVDDVTNVQYVMSVTGGGPPFHLAIPSNTGADSLVPFVSLSVSPGTFEADLSLATAVTINAMREAVQVQRMYERDARGGTRYIEIIKAHFGVTSPDARLQRPEYLGGGSSPINVHPIAQTNATGVTGTPQGNLAAFGTVSASKHGFTKSFVEHGLLIGLVSVRADLTYQQGLPRMFSRRTRFDYYWPALANLGEQAVLNQEIFWDGSANDALVFGYQENFAEYRFKPSIITGLFRSNVAASLDIWHLAQDFATLPELGAAFIEEDPPIDRVIATPSEPHFLFDSYFRMRCARPMPVYSVPGLMDHF